MNTTSKIQEVFGKPRVLLPVIHPVSRLKAITAARVAVDAGAPGVFLVDQGASEADVLMYVMDLRDRFPELWIGVNLLTRQPVEALIKARQECAGVISGIWADDAGINEHALFNEQPEPCRMLTAKMQLAWSGLYFGGVAFKYKRQVDHDDLGSAAARAAHYMDVVCTSGPETGKPASIEKIKAMHAGLGDGATSFAVASGITVDNVKTYLPYVDAYLVGTGIEKEFGVFDHVRVQALARKIEAWKP